MSSEGGDAVLGRRERQAAVAYELPNDNSKDCAGELEEVDELGFRRESQDAFEPCQPLQQTTTFAREVALEVLSINGANE